MNSIKNIKKGWILLLVFVAIFYAGFLFYSDIGVISEILYEINLWLIPLILSLRFGAIVLRSLRQRLFLNSLGIKLQSKFNLLLYVAGLAMIVTPASSGTIIKSYILNKKFGYSYNKTLPVIITEKYHDVLAPLSIIAFILIFIDIFEVRIIIVMLSAVMFGIFLIARVKNVLRKIIFQLPKIKILNQFQENFLDFYNSFRILSNKKIMIQGWLLGVASIAIYLGFVALGIDFGYMESLSTVYTANILGMVSFIPGGFGVVEASLMSLLIKSGFVLSVASSMVLITRFSGVWFQIILGFSVTSYLLKKIP